VSDVTVSPVQLGLCVLLGLLGLDFAAAEGTAVSDLLAFLQHW
jgi:hypothetical protein